MNEHPNLATLLVLLVATVVMVPLAKRFKLGAVLGYLFAGVVIGPHLLGLVRGGGGIELLSELGVVLMLFVIGLELAPHRLWAMRRVVFGNGLAQVLASTTILALIAGLGFGLAPATATIMGASLSLSSTAFGLQILSERKEAATAYGRQVFAVLLFQDLAAIPLIAAVPILAGGMAGKGFDPMHVIRTLAGIAVVAVAARYTLHWVFRFVAKAGAVEVSTAMALLMVLGTAWAVEEVGGSSTLGAFLAGVLLADSEYRHDLESHIEPFKGLFLGLFFISVGITLDIGVLLREPSKVLAMTLILLLVKGLLLWPLGRWLGRLSGQEALRFAVLLACGGEFAFVLLKLAHAQGLLRAEQNDRLVLAITLSMALTPLLVLLASHLLARQQPDSHEHPFDSIEPDAPRVVIAGFGRMGQIVGRILHAQGTPFVALDSSFEQIDMQRRFGNASLYFGDPTRLELLKAAHVEKAEVFVLASDDPQANLRIARVVQRHYPHLQLVARARNRQHAFRLMDLGVAMPVRETFHSSLKMTEMTLEALGFPSAVAQSRVDRFRQHDESLLRTQALLYDDEAKLVQSAQEALVELVQLFEADAATPASTPTPASDSHR